MTTEPVSDTRLNPEKTGMKICPCTNCENGSRIVQKKMQKILKLASDRHQLQSANAVFNRQKAIKTKVARCL